MAAKSKANIRYTRITGISYSHYVNIQMLRRIIKSTKSYGKYVKLKLKRSKHNQHIKPKLVSQVISATLSYSWYGRNTAATKSYTRLVKLYHSIVGTSSITTAT